VTVQVPDSVGLAPGALEAMIAHAHDDAPAECCGLLVGTPAHIDESVRTANLAGSPVRFRVDPGEHIALNRSLRGSGRQVIGVYHSHPHSAAEPSPVDVAEAHYPEFMYVIVSLADPCRPDVRAYRIRDAQVSRVFLAVDCG
jgi:proteasome lid subunit RPN8/RPN11